MDQCSLSEHQHLSKIATADEVNLGYDAICSRLKESLPV
jgi:hypothetical protein